MKDLQPTSKTNSVDEFTRRTPGVAHVVLLSGDLTLIQSNVDLPGEAAEQAAALVAQLLGEVEAFALAMEAGAYRQVRLEAPDGWTILTPVEPDCCLVVFLEPEADIHTAEQEVRMFASELSATEPHI